jgi:hypothetical protein
MELKRVIETDDCETVNQLDKSGEFRQPIYDNLRHVYILIRRKGYNGKSKQ